MKDNDLCEIENTWTIPIITPRLLPRESLQSLAQEGDPGTFPKFAKVSTGMETAS